MVIIIISIPIIVPGKILIKILLGGFNVFPVHIKIVNLFYNVGDDVASFLAINKWGTGRLGRAW